MIPTAYRAKLPRHLSYPVGAGAVSDALAGAPHVEAFTLTFYSQPVHPASEFRRWLVERRPYKVIEANYQPERKPGLSGADFMVQNGWYDEKWELTVYPVLTGFRSRANGLLLETGLPDIAAWLKSSDRAGWAATWQRIELVFDPAGESLASHESRGV